MPPSAKEKGLIIRHSERCEVELPAELVISDIHAKQVHFSATCESISPNHIPCTVVDVSSGGVGIETRHFLPRMTEGVIRVLQRDKGGKQGAMLMEHPVKVRRVEMIGREPSYAIGLAFTERTPELEKRIAQLSDQLHQEKRHA